VPETTVQENRAPLLWKHDVGGAPKRFDWTQMLPKPKTAAMKQAANQALGLGVLGAIALHD
jgi:hypothetical protein